MFTKEDVEKQLSPIVERDVVTGKMIIRTGERTAIYVDMFIEMFGDSELTYESLTKNPNATGGWNDIFTKWHEKGYI